MNERNESQRSEILNDPRRQPGFQASHYPRVNGQASPPLDAAERNDQIKLDFLATYYRLNCAYNDLINVRQGAESPERREAEKKCLQSIEKLLIVRDGLEDEYAPLGVIAEPVVENGFTVNVKISFGNVDAAGRRRSDCYTVTARVPIPLPQGARFEDLLISIEGPGINAD